MKKISKIDLSLFNKQLILKNVGFSGQNKFFFSKKNFGNRYRRLRLSFVALFS